MAKFQGSGFVLDLPDGSVDASTYAFALPSDGEYPPSLIIRFERQRHLPDLGAYAATERRMLEERVEELRVISEVASRRGPCDCLDVAYEYGIEQGRMRQQQRYLTMPGERATLFSLTVTDRAEHFERAEAMIEAVLDSFTPNDTQVL